MPAYERLASALIGTRWQRPVERLRRLGLIWERWKHPELREVIDEGAQIALLLPRVISGKTNCVDVGSHLGSMLSEFIRLAPHGRHIACEPVPYKAAWLRKKFPSVDVREVALADSQGQTEFFINPQSSGHSGLKANQSVGAATKIDVTLARLDDIVGEDLRVGFLKIDVEGAEHAVFRGAVRTLASSKPVVLFECTQAGLANSGSDARQLHAFLTQDVKYGIYLIKDWLAGANPLNADAFAAAMNYPFRAFNFVAAPQ